MFEGAAVVGLALLEEMPAVAGAFPRPIDLVPQGICLAVPFAFDGWLVLCVVLQGDCPGQHGEWLPLPAHCFAALDRSVPSAAASRRASARRDPTSTK
ncbi:hypothetical protein [Amycolatopsis panacis]|uniref:hypothetical protein n=1 Tax=Amycolatopsis panacis TaxID=2340917 RepID=UPI0011C4299E|nr:hypothetical protein [Amycolatopsis panacis]